MYFTQEALPNLVNRLYGGSFLRGIIHHQVNSAGLEAQPKGQVKNGLVGF